MQVQRSLPLRHSGRRVQGSAVPLTAFLSADLCSSIYASLSLDVILFLLSLIGQGMLLSVGGGPCGHMEVLLTIVQCYYFVRLIVLLQLQYAFDEGVPVLSTVHCTINCASITHCTTNCLIITHCNLRSLSSRSLRSIQKNLRSRCLL